MRRFLVSGLAKTPALTTPVGLTPATHSRELIRTPYQVCRHSGPTGSPKCLPKQGRGAGAFRRPLPESFSFGAMCLLREWRPDRTIPFRQGDFYTRAPPSSIPFSTKEPGQQTLAASSTPISLRARSHIGQSARERDREYPLIKGAAPKFVCRPEAAQTGTQHRADVSCFAVASPQELQKGKLRWPCGGGSIGGLLLLTAALFGFSYD